MSIFLPSERVASTICTLFTPCVILPQIVVNVNGSHSIVGIFTNECRWQEIINWIFFSSRIYYHKESPRQSGSYASVGIGRKDNFHQQCGHCNCEWPTTILLIRQYFFLLVPQSGPRFRPSIRRDLLSPLRQRLALQLMKHNTEISALHLPMSKIFCIPDTTGWSAVSSSAPSSVGRSSFTPWKQWDCYVLSPKNVVP